MYSTDKTLSLKNQQKKCAKAGQKRPKTCKKRPTIKKKKKTFAKCANTSENLQKDAQETPKNVQKMHANPFFPHTYSDIETVPGPHFWCPIMKE